MKGLIGLSMMLKIAFLFLFVCDGYHQDCWQFFFKDRQEYYSLYVHSKESVPQDSFFKNYEIPVKVPTTWANSVEAQIALLEEALKDPANEKFIFASESTLPLQSFDVVYKTVMASSGSIFSYHRNPHSSINNARYAYRNLNLIPEEFHYKTSQWVILNRKHAELIVQDKEYLNKIIHYEADNELYFGVFLASKNLLHEVLPIDMTYVDWQKCNKEGRKFPHEFDDLHDQYNANQALNAINNDVLFMRKFSKESDLSVLKPYLAYWPKDDNVTPFKFALYNRCVKNRYSLIQSVLDNYQTPFTVLDCGACQGYYSYKIAGDYSATCVLWEESDSTIEHKPSRLWDLHNHIYNNHNVLLFNKSINSQEIEDLSVCSSFDVVLAFNLIELFDKKWHEILQALLKIGNKIIVEVPEDDSLEAADLRTYLLKKEALCLGDLQENNEKISTLYLLQNNDREFSIKVS